MLPYIPPELCDHIIDYLHDDRASLASCALACHAWLPSARYHQFRETKLDWKTFDSFLEIVSASPGIARAVASLEIYSSHPKSTVWREVDFSFLAQLPSVRTLILTNLGMDVSVHTALIQYLQTPTTLTITWCWFESFDDLAALVASFPALEALVLDSNLWNRRRRQESITADEPWESRPPPRLKKLEVVASQSNPQLYDPQLVHDWLLSPSSPDAERGTKLLEALGYCVQSATDALDLMLLLDSIAPTLKDLDLVVEQEEQLEGMRYFDFVYVRTTYLLLMMDSNRHHQLFSEIPNSHWKHVRHSRVAPCASTCARCVCRRTSR